MGDIEAQLKGLSIQTSGPVKKENECLFLCKQCKWNIMLLTMSGGISSDIFLYLIRLSIFIIAIS